MAVTHIEVIRHIDTGIKTIPHGKAHILCRYRKAHMPHVHGNAEALHERGLTGHIGAGEKEQVGVLTELNGIGHAIAEAWVTKRAALKIFSEAGRAVA